MAAQTELVRSEGTPEIIPSSQWQDQALQYLDKCKRAGLLPRGLSPEGAFLVLHRGRELGLPMGQALSGLYVVNGKVAMDAQTMIALVHEKGLGAFEIESTDEGATVTAIHRNGTRYTATFTREDAERAGLLKKGGPWAQYPRQMMKWRAVSEAARTVFPEIFLGIYTPDEAEDIADAPDPVPALPSETPRPEPTLRMMGPQEREQIRAAREAAGLSKQETTRLLLQAGYRKPLEQTPVSELPRILDLIGSHAKQPAEGQDQEPEAGPADQPVPVPQELADEINGIMDRLDLPDEQRAKLWEAYRGAERELLADLEEKLTAERDQDGEDDSEQVGEFQVRPPKGNPKQVPASGNVSRQGPEEQGRLLRLPAAAAAIGACCAAMWGASHALPGPDSP
ncbi:MAG: recombinase RecT, partial [Armatimonadetes bacterium]|nr:recombinase RecT [Armatimonadota bacterium]